MTEGRRLQVPVARVFLPAHRRSRYIGEHGGRGSAKSHDRAGALVKRAIEQPGLRWMCIREVQKSLAQSAKRTIENKIQAFGVGGDFDVQKAEIRTPGGWDAETGKYMQPGVIVFQGMQNHTAESVKSYEDFDGQWTEEAQTLSQTSLRMLRPTIRKRTQLLNNTYRDSEHWFTWNPRNADDPVDALLRGPTPPPGAIVLRSNYYDNPWFHETALVEEMLYDKRRDKDTYDHVWLGEYERHSEARVFKNWRVEDFEPPNARDTLYAGADWGFSIDPTVLVVGFIRGRTFYIWREVWKLGLEIDRIPTAFDHIDPEWTAQKAVDPNWRSLARKLSIMADSARPDTISYVQRHGFPRLQPALKGPGSIEDGIEFLKSYDIVVHPDCKHVEAELKRYAYKIDKNTDKVTSELADKDNHTIDSLRYAVENVRRAHSASVMEWRL
jgi:phage terminase large subunit